MKPSEMRERMLAGGVMTGMGVRLARCTELAHVAKAAGLDWLFLDMEHNALSPDMACQIACAALDAGVVPLARIPGHEPTIASRLLDGGVGGIVVPHVDSPEEILPVIEQCRFAPGGRRSFGGPVPQLDYATMPIPEMMRKVDQETLICAMIESPKAVENAGAIASLPGVDMLLIGSNDLALEMGRPGQLDHPEMEKAFERVIRAAGEAGKSVGLGGIYVRELQARYVPLGFRFVLLGSDLSLLLGSLKERIQVAREFARPA